MSKQEFYAIRNGVRTRVPFANAIDPDSLRSYPDYFRALKEIPCFLCDTERNFPTGKGWMVYSIESGYAILARPIKDHREAVSTAASNIAEYGVEEVRKIIDSIAGTPQAVNRHAA